MAEDSAHDSEDEFREMLSKFLSGTGDIDPASLAHAAGLPNDPVMLAKLISQLQNALTATGDSINWDLAREQAQTIASQDQVDSPPTQRAALEQAFHIAELWLNEATGISELTATPKLLSRAQWITATLPIWIQLAEPVALSIAGSLTEVLREQAPEEFSGMIDGASKIMRTVGGTLFAIQLGQVVGQLSSEVVSGGDIGIPLLGSTSDDQQAAILPQNAAAFGAGLDIESDQIEIYLAVRELAHARLFRHAKWLKMLVLGSITDSAQGNRINTDRLEQLANEFDPASPESLREAMVSGALIAPKSPAQLAALTRLETLLALVEGWVDVVTASATARLPKADAIAETVRRRRASGGPAESAFSTLVGLELRPRRLREAAALWQKITDDVGSARRDELWSHPDLVPTTEDLDDPAALIARLTGETPETDDVDRAIEELLRDDRDNRPHEGTAGEQTP